MRLRIRRILTAAFLLSAQYGTEAQQVRSSPVHESAQGTSTAYGPERAPITIIAFSDFESFPCARSAAVLTGILGENGQVRLIFKNAPAATNPNAHLAHEAALAAAAQGKFWEMHSLLFENQTKLSRSDLFTYAKLLGLNMVAFERALDRHTYSAMIERDLAEARGLGVATTPTLFINGRRLVGPQGYASVSAVIDTALAGIPESQRVVPEIVASGPAQQINLANTAARGPATAPVTLVEFSDFKCPFCARAAPIARQLVAAYPTQVRFAFKHYPLPMHQESPLAHEAVLAAGDQGKFWDMHDALFAGQDKLAREDLIAKAKQLGLDVPRFTKDLDSHRFKPQVDADRQEGNRLGVDGTPFFFINGHAISGALELPTFKKLIDAALKESAAATKPAAAK